MKHWLVALLSCLALAGLYLLYWNHAEYVIDDWGHYLFYQRAAGGGLAARWEVLRGLFDSRLYGGYQLFWLSQWMNCLLVVWPFGYSPKAAFVTLVLLHAINSWLFYLLLDRLGVGRRLAYFTAACLVVIPSAHGPLFWALNCSFFVWPMFFLLLYLLVTQRALAAGWVSARAAAASVVLILAVLFAGSPAAVVLLVAAPWTALCFFGRRRRQTGLIVALLLGAAVPAGLEFYQRTRYRHRLAPAKRFRWNLPMLAANAYTTVADLGKLSGVARSSYYDIWKSPAAIGAGLAAALLVAAASRRLANQGERQPAWRIALYAAGMGLAAYAPMAVLNSKGLRHYYTFSPFLALLLLLPARRLGLAWGAAWCGCFAAGAVGEIRQCWIPQSQAHQRFKQAIVEVDNLDPGDWVVAPGVELLRGTAPAFALGGPPWDARFVQVVTGVAGLEFAREVVVEQGRLRLYHRHKMSDLTPAELARLHVLAPDATGRYARRRYLAWEQEAGRFLLVPLKGSAPPPSGDQLLTREQLAPHLGQVHFPKPFEHGNPQLSEY